MDKADRDDLRAHMATVARIYEPGFCPRISQHEILALLAAADERDAARAEAARLQEHLHRAEKHERELADALEFYGDEGIYDMVLTGGGVFRRIRTIMQDHGARARAALAAADMASDVTEPRE